jgi:hypothetical protein
MSTLVLGARLQGVTRSIPGTHVVSAACHSVEHANSEPSSFPLRRPRSSKGSLSTDEAIICELNSQQSPRSPLDVAASQQCADSVGASVRADVDATGHEVVDEASQYSTISNAAPTAPPQTSNKRRAPASAAPGQTARYNSAAAAAAPNLVNQPRTTLISAQLGWYDGRQRRNSTSSTAQRVPQSRTDPAAPYRAGATAASKTVANATTELDRPSYWNRSVPTKANSPHKRSRLRAPTSGTIARSVETFGHVPQQSPKASKRSRTQQQQHTYQLGGEMITDGVSLAESFKSASLPRTAAASKVMDIKSVSFKPSFFEKELVVVSQAAAEEITSDCDNDKAYSNNADIPDGSRTTDDTTVKGVLVAPSKSSSWRPAFDSSIASSTAQLSPQTGRVNKRQRSSSTPGGPISQLLQRLRTRHEGDAARLLSGEYPFRLGRVDLSDPRSRCLCAVDVTILQQCSTAVARTTHLHVLCYVHQVSILKHSAQTSTKQLNDDTTDAVQAVYMQHMNECLPKAVVKLILRADVNNTLRLGFGVQLRVYDPLLLHAVSHGGRTSQAVMTADLCESYPSQQLQALSPPPTHNMWNATSVQKVQGSNRVL